MRISTENGSDHIQTKIVERFVKTVNERLGNEINATHYHSGVLFRDKDVVKALERGQVEMAVPGNWHLDKYERKAGVFLLPSFYSLSYEELNTLRDGEYGAKIDRAIEQRTGTIVLGRWIDLGYAHIYSLDKPIKKYADLKGMRIRVAGGAANIARMQALGANAVSIPWGDLPSAIKEGKIDGILTTHESVASAKLWEDGVLYCFENNDYFPMYIPLLSRRFYEKIPPNTREELRNIWELQVDEARKEAALSQAKARELLIKNGVKMTAPTKQTKEDAQKKLQKAEKELLLQLGLDPLFVDEALKK